MKNAPAAATAKGIQRKHLPLMTNTSLALTPKEIDTLIYLATKLRASMLEGRSRMHDGIPEADVLAVGCGWCHAVPGAACQKKQRNRGGKSVGSPVAPHTRRIRRARDIIARRSTVRGIA